MLHNGTEAMEQSYKQHIDNTHACMSSVWEFAMGQATQRNRNEPN